VNRGLLVFSAITDDTKASNDAEATHYKQSRRGVAHLRVQGKGDKMRFVPTHPGNLRCCRRSRTYSDAIPVFSLTLR
jgi:hypothetical protein